VLLRVRRSVVDRVAAAPPDDGARRFRFLAGYRYVLRRPWARAILITVFLEGMALFGPFAFMASHLHRVYALSLSAAGASLMLFAAGGLAFVALAPVLVRRLGERGMAATGGVLLFTALLLVGLGTAWPFALAGTFLAGAGYYTLHTTLQTHATQMAPERRGASVALFASAFFLGQSVGVGLASVAVQHLSTTPIIVAGALGTLAIGLAFSRLLGKHVTRIRVVAR
jgi:predicted MFS family arabinose efflux permease